MKTKKTAEKITAQNSLNNQSNTDYMNLDSVITKDEWQSGQYRKREDCKTLEGYYKAVDNFIAKYGEPTKQDMVLSRSGNRCEKKNGYGCSFTTNANICRRLAKRYLKDTIWWLYVPKGTMAVYLPSKGLYEEEFVLPIHKMKLGKNNFGVLATHYADFDYLSDWETQRDYETWKLKLSIELAQYVKILKPFFDDSNTRDYYKAA